MYMPDKKKSDCGKCKIPEKFYKDFKAHPEKYQLPQKKKSDYVQVVS